MGTESEDIQKNHFNNLIVEYETHYDGKDSQKYRDKFINQYLFQNIDLDGKKVLEAMAGSGQTTGYLISKGALVTGNDISDNAIERYKKRWPQATTVCSSIFETGLENDSFDCVVIVGGLHHLHPRVNDAVNEMYRVLKKGGYLCFFEPHKGSIADKFRQFWYRRDRFFESNEKAIDLVKLKAENSSGFDFITERYGGNIAYLLVLNSLIFRVPISIKNIVSPSLMLIEPLLSVFQGKLLSCFVISQWQKKQ